MTLSIVWSEMTPSLVLLGYCFTNGFNQPNVLPSNQSFNTIQKGSHFHYLLLAFSKYACWYSNCCNVALILIWLIVR